MKAKLIIIGWLTSFSLFATNNVFLAFIALCLFGASCTLASKHKKEVMDEADKLNKWIDNLINNHINKSYDKK